MSDFYTTRIADRIAALEAEVARLTREVGRLSSSHALAEWRKQHPDKQTWDIHGRWRDNPPPYATDLYETTDAVIAALVQESVVAWRGDGTSIVAQMIHAQSDARRKAEAENARLREALTFYADEGNWGSLADEGRHATSGIHSGDIKIEAPVRHRLGNAVDLGKRARDALNPPAPRQET